MGGLFGGDGGGGQSSSSVATQNSTIGGISAANANGRSVSSGGYIDDGAKRMPSASDAVTAENARQKRLGLTAQSGRTSTDLSGTRAYINNFLGNAG